MYCHCLFLNNFRMSTSCGGRVLCLHGNPDTGTVIFEDVKGKVFTYKNGKFL